MFSLVGPIVCWFAGIPASIFGLFTSYVLGGMIVLFCNDAGRLPVWLSWFQTPDNPMDGDVGFKEKHAWYRPATNSVQRWINRWWWLIRNPAYGLDMALGFEASALARSWSVGSAQGIVDEQHPGWYLHTLRNPDGQWAWQFYFVWRWPGTIYNVRINLGWKLWNWRFGAPCHCQWVLYLHPCKSSEP